MTPRRAWLLCAALAFAGCTGEHRAARDHYNAGVAALAKSDFAAAEKALIEARDQAGVDPELVFRATYDAGLAYAGHAEQVRGGKDADLEKALELANAAEGWFLDATRARPEDASAAANLAIMKTRIKQINDELSRGAGKLEARLDRLVGDQRGVLEQARAAWAAIKQAGGADPLAQRDALVNLADHERSILAEAGVVGDLAADEIDEIGKKAEDKRSDQEKVRVVELKNLDLYLMDGRSRITEARRKLQDLAAEDGVARAEAALVALKRAREQLVDPITVMREVWRDEIAVTQDTAQSEPHAFDAGGDKPAALPGWLEPAVVGERQGGIRDRLEEVRARLTAAAEPPPPANPPANATPAPPPEDPKRAKLVERIKAALPSVTDASAAMDRARQALAGKQIKQALDDEQVALDALARAIEQFSDLKQLVELAWGEHQELLALLGPEAAKQLDAAQRGKRTHEALGHNLARLPRMKELIADELAQLDEHAKELDAKAAAGAGSGAGSADPKQAEAAKQQLDAAKAELDQARQQMTHAEELRGQAQTALAALDKALAGSADPMPPAKDADAKLTELRKLFFSVIEHLQQLIRDQGETRDQTSAANSEDDFTRGPKLPGLVSRQEEHAQMAKAITDALAQQADAAGKQPPQPGKQGPDAKALAGAADEVRQSQTDMADARGTLVKARDAKAQTESLEPGVKSQAKALEHLQNALNLLQPPPQKQDQKNDQKDQQQQQQQQQKKQDKPPQQQGGAGQRARDEDARRQRDRNSRDLQNDPVEKDW